MFPIKDNHIVVPMPQANDYNIPLSQCNTPEKILAWVIQLSEKSWVTREIIEEFIDAALKQHGLSRPQF